MNLRSFFLRTFPTVFRDPEARAGRHRNSRSYLAGKINRLNRNWPYMQNSPRNEVQRSLRTIRARMRFLARNSDFFKRFLSMYATNVAGPYGMKLQVTGGTEAENTHIELRFQKWCHQEFASVSQRLTFTQILRRICTTHGRDGEVLIREIYGTNAFGYALKFYNVDWLDETFNQTRPNGNRVVMSVEIDADERPVAYWLTPPSSELALGFQPTITTRTRIPAEEIFHLFLPDDENSSDDTLTRGVPPGHTAAMTLFTLDRADEANLYSLLAGASKMGFVTSKTDDDDESETDKETGEEQTIIDHFEPGTIWELPPGKDFKPFDPQFPNQAHDPFAKYMLRRAASGLDVFYHSLTGDLADVNLSTIRAGLLEEREHWKSRQEWLAESFCRRLFVNWLKSSVLTGMVQLRPKDLDRFHESRFQPRRWPWPDPLKDVQTLRLGVEAGFNTITDVLAEQGEDIREIFTKRKAELDLAKKLDIPLAAGAGTVTPETFAGEDPKTPADGKKKPEK